jgi:hypothetical protein
MKSSSVEETDSGMRNDESSIDSELNRLLRNAVAGGLRHFGDRSIVESLFYILELEHSVNLTSIASNLPTLLSGLKAMFGAGEEVIENKIREELARQIGVDPSGRTIETLIQMTRKMIETQKAEGIEA